MLVDNSGAKRGLFAPDMHVGRQFGGEKGLFAPDIHVGRQFGGEKGLFAPDGHDGAGVKEKRLVPVGPTSYFFCV
jgi:hypothetical protein